MKEVSIVGLDLAKRVFQVHAAGADGGVVLRRKLSRGQVLAFCGIAAVHCCDGSLCHRALGTRDRKDRPNRRERPSAVPRRSTKNKNRMYATISGLGSAFRPSPGIHHQPADHHAGSRRTFTIRLTLACLGNSSCSDP